MNNLVSIHDKKLTTIIKAYANIEDIHGNLKCHFCSIHKEYLINVVHQNTLKQMCSNCAVYKLNK